MISKNKHFISQTLKVVGPLGEKFDFFSPSGFEIHSDFNYRTSKIKFYSVTASKYYLNEKNLIHECVSILCMRRLLEHHTSQREFGALLSIS